MQELTLKIIRIIHYLFLAFMIFVPFFGGELLLSYHFITVPFLILHWLTNNDVCALTLIESKLTGKTEDQTFIGNIIKPIYNMHLESKHYYWITAILFAVTTYRLWSVYQFKYLRLVWSIVKLSITRLKQKVIN